MKMYMLVDQGNMTGRATYPNLVSLVFIFPTRLTSTICDAMPFCSGNCMSMAKCRNKTLVTVLLQNTAFCSGEEVLLTLLYIHCDSMLYSG